MNRFAALLIISMLGTSIAVCQTDTLITVYFETDKSELSVGEQAKLVDFIWESDSIILKSIHIDAFCDDRGTLAYNEELSSKRAEETRKILSNLDIHDSLFINVSGRGEISLDQTINKETDEIRRLNRKADVFLSYFILQQKTVEPVVEVIPEDVAIGDTLILENILFFGGRHVLLPESYPTLDRLLEILQTRPDLHIKILGHVCCTDEYDGWDNDTETRNLSVNRARTIYNHLIQKGIDPDRLEYEGLGSAYKLGGADKYDRRVEIEITKIK